MGSPQQLRHPDEDEEEAPSSDYSSCEIESEENDRYSSANSFLDSASLDSFRSFGSERSFRSLEYSSCLDYKSEEVEEAARSGENRGVLFNEDDRLLRGRLPRIRTVRSFRDRGRKLPSFSPATTRGGASSRSSSSLARRNDGDDPTALDYRAKIGVRQSAVNSNLLGPSDASVGENVEEDEVFVAKIDSGTNGTPFDRRLPGTVNALDGVEVEGLGSNGLSNSPSTGRGCSDFVDQNSSSPICSTSYSSRESAKIDGIEVVGTRQKKGDVSFGERLIGVKEYGLYKLKVWSGGDEWEIERRYHDFFLLYCRLKALYKDHGLRLPPPWSKVLNESRKIFGNASPTVIKERSVLIQDCLQSILNAGAPFGTPSCLIWFLSPVNSSCDLNVPIDLLPHTFLRLKNDGIQDLSTLHRLLSQIVKTKDHKSKKELLEEQGYTCAGCHRHINSKMSSVEELIQMLGWGRFQVCEFTGQLFCSLCHSNETAVLPARVLQHWDFSLYPVSNAAKSFLNFVYNQPILCIGAVNPFLFLKVSSLLNVIDLRKKIGAILPYIRCPFRRSIEIYFGSRKYLLEANDLFALRDLIDLSKGAFAELPALLNNLLRKIHDHMMKQCPVCYELGVPCAAQNACRESSFHIFPLQEAGIIRCASCGFIYHEGCFRYLAACQCGEANLVNRIVGLLGPQDPGEEIELDGFVDSTPNNSNEQSLGYASKLISKARPDFQWIPRNSRLVVTMNSLLDAFS